MEYRKINGLDVSLLGFGCMRFPTTKKGTIDAEKAEEFLDYAYAHGVNYFDTAYMYHGGESEVVIGKILKKYPRESFFLADKLPLWCINEESDLEKIFNEQLTRCQVTYFDFYLCHALNKGYMDKMQQFQVLNFLQKQRELGRIKHIGFSFHDTPQVLQEYVDMFDWDFAQIQFNYLDYDMQNAKLQYEILENRSIPVVVMEPVRGGMLAKLSDAAERILKAAAPDRSIASWAMRFAATPNNVLCVLSGMSTEQQVRDNVSTFSAFQPLQNADIATIDSALSEFRTKISIPCTGCRYCMDCPSGVDIPQIFALYNRHMIANDNNNYRMAYRNLDDKIKASHCVSCGKCLKHCPQKIDIPAQLKKIHDIVK